MLARLTNGLEFVANERNADFSMAQAYLFRAGRYQALSPPQAGGKFEAYDLNAQGTVVGSALSHMDGPQLKGSVAAAFRGLGDKHSLGVEGVSGNWPGPTEIVA